MEFISLQSFDGAKAKICTQGAHLTSWITANGEEQLFLSQLSAFKSGVAIRGGVPIIFPQFSDHGTLPRHGFARTSVWELISVQQMPNGLAQAVLVLSSNDETKKIWPYDFHLTMKVTVGGNKLELELMIKNTGQETFSFTNALHTYLRVENVSKTHLKGLKGLVYDDFVSLEKRCVEQSEELSIVGEIDRVYADISANIEMNDGQRAIHIKQTNFSDAVVWNPGAEKAAALNDLERDGYKKMLCIEAGNVLRSITLESGATWSGTQEIQATYA